MNSQNDVFSLNKYNDALLAGNIGGDGNLQVNAIAGWFGGGASTIFGTTVFSYVQKITYATDTAIASLCGNMAITEYAASGV